MLLTSVSLLLFVSIRLSRDCAGKTSGEKSSSKLSPTAAAVGLLLSGQFRGLDMCLGRQWLATKSDAKTDKSNQIKSINK